MPRNRGSRFAPAILLPLFVLPGCRNDSTAVPQYDAETFYETTSISGSSFSPDESRILITMDASGVFNVYAQPVQGGPPEQLTQSASDAILSVGWFPEDERFLYMSDQGGNELFHLYVRERDASVRDLTPGEKVRGLFVRWGGDDQSFWVTTNERDARFNDLYRYQTDGYSRELVFRNDAGYEIGTVSADGQWVALNKIRNNADSDVYLWNVVEGGEPILVTPHEGEAEHGVGGFSPDSRRLVYLTDEHGEYQQAWSYGVTDSALAPVIIADWDVVAVWFSHNGRYRASAVNQDARTVISVLDTSTGKEVDLPELPDGDIADVSFSRSERLMAFYVNSDTSPSNLHVLDLETGQERQLTHSLNPAIRQEHLVDGEVVRYKSFDGMEIPALLYRPHDASAQNKAPGLVWVHGGPGGQSRRGYSAIIQHLVNHGYAVIAVNNRGSSGYGKTFHHLDDRKHGEVDLQDCVWARKHLEGLDWIDGDRVGIIGGSYGGYMVAAALAFEPDAFDVGVDIFGVTNWLRTLKSIPPWWASFREGLYAEMGDPATDEERLRRISPLFHAANIRKPLLVIQGANDPRVLQVESDELVEAVRANKVPVDYVVFPDEGHGFRRKSNRIQASKKFVEFLDRYLKGESASAGS